jgi:outer membrane receptor for ferrienterochelin and colicin
MRAGFLLAACLLVWLNAWAGVTGKIAGTVRDEKGQPVPFANVVVVGQPKGAATDMDGDYVILNLAPGQYSLNFTCVGYASVRVDKVNVNVDLTTRRDMVLNQGAVAGTELTIVAERALVQVDQTYSASYVDANQLKAMPVTELSQVVALQAGVVDGHFRGGRSGEVLYLVDGIPVTDVYDGSRGVDVQVSMVQELQVLSGTFNAEYGQAMSGVVNTVTRDAGDKPAFSVSGYLGDYLSGHTSQFRNIDEVDPLQLSNVELGFSSPTPLPWLSLNGSLRYTDNNGWLQGQRLFAPGEKIGAWESNGVAYRFFNADQVMGFSQGEMFGEDWFFLVDQDMQEAWNALIAAGNWPMEDAADSSAVLGMYQWADERSHELYERSSGDRSGRDNVDMDTEVRRAAQLKVRAELGEGSVLRAMWLANDRNYRDFSQGWRYTPDARQFRYSRSQLTSLKWDKVLSDDTFMDLSLSHSLNQYHHRLYDSVMDSRYVSDEWLPAESGFYFYPLYEVNPVDPMAGDDIYIGFAQMGGTENEHFSRRTDTWGLKGNATRQWGKRHMWKTGFEWKGHRLAFDQQSVSFNGNEIVEPQGANDNHYVRRPWEASAYVQDKIEFSDVTVNAGLRMDIFDANDSLPVDLRDPANSPMRHVDTKWQVSPRLAIAYVVSENGVLHFSYGHFFQRPAFDVLYQNPDFELTGLNTVVGNPDLDVERTVQYEIGMQQQLGEDVALDLSFYSRDIRDLVSTDLQIETVTVDKYYMYTNRDFGTVKGFVLSLDKRYQGGFSAGLDYTFQVAEANASSADAARNAIEGGKEVNKYLIPLNWDRRHTLNGSLSLDRATWGLSLIGSYGSGLPYTPTPQSDDLVVGLLENSGRKPAYVNFDLSGYWNVLKQPEVQLNFQVKNLLDRLNENNVFARTGRAGYDIDWQDVQSELVVDPGNYSRPREVIIGFRVGL